MRSLLVCMALLVLSARAQAQWDRDKVYDDVVSVTEKDVTANAGDFLIDIPIRPKTEMLVLYNNDARIPPKLFFDRTSFLPEQQEILLIVPDWSYYRGIRASEKRKGYHLKPVVQNKFYHIQRNKDGYAVDSLARRMDDPGNPVKLNFAVAKLNENETKWYIQDCYGSTCCPHDPKWDGVSALQNDVAAFERRYNVKMNEGVFKRILGKEGEHCSYFPLGHLTNDQRLQLLHIFVKSEKPHAQLFLPILLEMR